MLYEKQTLFIRRNNNLTVEYAKNLNIGDKVLSYHDYRQQVIETIITSISHIQKECICFTVDNHTIATSLDYQLSIYRNRIQTSQLNSDHKCLKIYCLDLLNQGIKYHYYQGWLLGSICQYKYSHNISKQVMYQINNYLTNYKTLLELTNIFQSKLFICGILDGLIETYGEYTKYGYYIPALEATKLIPQCESICALLGYKCITHHHSNGKILQITKYKQRYRRHYYVNNITFKGMQNTMSFTTDKPLRNIILSSGVII